MKLRLIITILLGVFIGFEFSAQGVCNYKYRKRITFDPTKVNGPSDLTSYPALISIAADNDLRFTPSGHVENSNGFDIIFTAADGVTLLDFQLEKYTSGTGELVVWVKIPTLSTTINTDIYMYYGNPAIGANQSSNSTWNTNYKGIYNLHADYTDKSGTGNNGANNGLTLSTGTIANGSTFNNANDYATIGTSGWSATTATYEMWIRSTGAWPAAEAYFLGHTTLAAYNNRIQIYAFNGKLRVGLGSSHAIGGDLFTFATNTWYHVAVIYSAGNHTVCVNGSTVYVNTYTGMTTIGVADIGNNGNDHTQAMTAGNVDQMMISNINRNTDWIRTEYNNQSAPSTFYSISTEPYRWLGTTSANWSVGSNWLGGAIPPSDADVIITSVVNQPTLSANVQVKSIWLQSTTTLSLGVSSLSFRYDVTNCGTVTGALGSLIANSTTHAQTEYLSGTGTFNLFNFSVNNTFATSPAVRLMKNVNVNGALTLSSGILYTSTTNILALSNIATSGSGLVTSFVSGPMSKNGATDFVFPVGKGNKWRRCAVTSISSAATYTAEYFNSAFTSTSPVNAPLNNVSLIEYWQCDRSAAGNAKLTLYWEDASVSGINNCADLTIARWNGASWDERPATAGGSCSGTGAGSVVTNAILTAFSPFTFGSKLGSVNPLPISLLAFTATALHNQVNLDWSTATEKNNDFFTIEKSIDGLNTEFVEKVAGRGNTNSVNNYSLIDANPYNGISYYRLKQTDFNGDVQYSPFVAVNFNRDEYLNYSLFPNPNNGTFAIRGIINENTEITIFNVLGQKVDYSISSKSENSININNTSFPIGIYFVVVKNNQIVSNHKLIVE